MFDGLPRTRAEARETGSKHYFTGKPCKHGHIAPRLTSNRGCVECSGIARKQWGQENSAHLAEYGRAYSAANKEHLRDLWKNWYAENRDAVIVDKRQRYIENRDSALAYAKEYRERAPDKVLAASAKWRSNNVAKLRENWLAWYAKNGKARDAKRRSTPKGKIDSSMSRAIYGALADKKGGRRWESLVDYTLTDLVNHLERQFQPGMTWDNYGRDGWHIDHIIPRSAFNYETSDDIDFKRCWALTNLQPLWGTDNIKKGARLSAPFQPSLALAVGANTTTSENTVHG